MTNQARVCPMPGCDRRLGTTRYGEPFAFCRVHWQRIPKNLQQRVWITYKAWQRLEKQWLKQLPGVRPPALLLARATAIQAYLDARNDCVRKIAMGAEQMELAQ